jgi:hypothetical protein
VPESEKHDVEIEYELASRLRFNDGGRPHRQPGARRLKRHRESAPGEGDAPGERSSFRVKDKLENKLLDLVCDGTMTLGSVQKQIAANWQALYKRVFGITPTG